MNYKDENAGFIDSLEKRIMQYPKLSTFSSFMVGSVPALFDSYYSGFDNLLLADLTVPFFLSYFTYGFSKYLKNNQIKFSNLKKDMVIEKTKTISNFLDKFGSIYYKSDKDGNFDFVSNSLSEQLGYKNDELKGKSISSIYYDSKDNDLFLSELKKSNTLVEYEVKLKTKNCDEKWFSVNSKLNNDGSIEGFLNNITLRKKFELDSLIYKSSFEHAPVSIVITDEKADIVKVNPYFLKDLEYENASELVGKNISIFKSGKTDPFVYCDLWNTLVQGDTWAGEFINKKKSGVEYFEKSTISSIKNDLGVITHYVAIKEDITQIKKMTDKLQRSANYDSLTSLVNRNLFFGGKLFSNLIYNSHRSDKYLSFLYLDLDGFKQINDNYGHNIGDEVLKEASNRFKKLVTRESDIVARLGGDEFGIAIGNQDSINYSIGLASKIIDEINKPFIIGSYVFNSDNKIDLGTSIGIVSTDSHKNMSALDLVKLADSGMYESKRTGKNRYTIAPVQIKFE